MTRHSITPPCGTTSARIPPPRAISLFGLRAELFSLGFVKTLADWCREHKIQLTGHVDQEEIVNPVGLCGDLIKVFEYQPMPGLDQIFQYDRGAPMYKVVSSAAVNYGHQTVMTECYGAIDLPLPNLYREAMDQFVKGVNLMVPHAVWYRSDKITFPPELSYRTEPYASELPRYNEYIGRLQRVLRHGRPVVDIAVMYPIHGLQAAYYFGPGEPYKGGVIPEWADYMDVGERLSLDLRHDFTYLHPETLDARCEVADGQIALAGPGESAAVSCHDPARHGSHVGIESGEDQGVLRSRWPSHRDHALARQGDGARQERRSAALVLAHVW